MHDHHDEDLILDLLDDRTSSDADISARLDGCEQCMADFSEQRSVLAALADLDTPTLTGDERAAIRTAVLDQIEPAPVIPLKRSWDWTRLGTVAAALVGVVAVAGMLSMIGSGDADLADDGAADAAAVAQAGDEADTMAFESVATDDAAEESAGGGIDSAPSLAPPSELVVALGSVDRAGLADELDRLRGEVSDMTESSGVLQRDADTVDVSCVVELPDPGAVRAIATAVVDGSEVEVYLDLDGVAVAFLSGDCSPYELP